MKKRIFLVLILVMMIVLTGCDKNEKLNTETKKESIKTLTCTLNKELASGVVMENTYNATYKGEDVQVVETIEKVISDNNEYLEKVLEQVKSIYEPFKDIKYYESNVEINGNTLLSSAKIDYSKIDYNELIKVNSEIASIMKDGKLKIEDLKSIYTQVGAKCK